MHKSIPTLAILTADILAAAPTANAQTKLGIVDMNSIFTQYYKTKDAEAKLNEARTAAKKEFDDRLETLKKASETINKLGQEIEKPELSKEGKEKATKQRDEKLLEARNLDRETSEFKSTRKR